MNVCMCVCWYVYTFVSSKVRLWCFFDIVGMYLCLYVGVNTIVCNLRFQLNVHYVKKLQATLTKTEFIIVQFSQRIWHVNNFPKFLSVNITDTIFFFNLNIQFNIFILHTHLISCSKTSFFHFKAKRKNLASFINRIKT